MKNKFLLPFSLLAVLALTGCTTTVLKGEKSTDSSSSITDTEVSGSTTEVEIVEDTVVSSFSLKDTSGKMGFISSPPQVNLLRLVN